MAKKKKITPEPITKEETAPEIKKGVTDGSWGSAIASNSVAPLAIKTMLAGLTPIHAYELSSCVRTCIRARNEIFNSVKIRLFNKYYGQEVFGGTANQFWAKPNDFQNGSSFIHAVASWLDMSGERVSLVREYAPPMFNNQGERVNYKAVGRLTAQALNPFSLYFQTPARPRLPEEIKTWKYIWENGDVENLDASVIVFEHDYNPSSKIRGNPPLISVANSIQAFYKAQKYIASFFGNNARPSNIINVKTDNPDQTEAFKKEYLSGMQGEDNAWLSFFTTGDQVTVTPIEAPLSEAPFQELLRNVKSEVASLFMVPPLHSGDFDKTRFDSVEEQNVYFYESVIIPRVEVLQSYCQQIQDRFFANSSIQNCRKVPMTKSFSDKLEKAKSLASSDIVVVLDIDHLPQIAALKMKKVKYASELQRAFKITPNQSAIEVGMDIETNDAGNLVWYDSNQKFVEHVKADTTPQTPLTVAQSTPTEPEPVKPPTLLSTEAEVQESDVVPQKPKNEKGIKDFYRMLRKLTLDKKDNNSMWTLNEADKLAEQCGVKEDLYKDIRVDFRNLHKQMDKDFIKKYFNKHLKNVIKGTK